LNEAWKLLQFELDDVTITNGYVRLEDHSISPHYEKQVTNLYLNLVGLKPNAAEPAKVNIAGNIMPSGPFSVVGEFTTASTNIAAKVAINAQMIQLSPQSPYAEKFLGHLIDNGNVSMDLRYELNGVLVKGENRVIVNAFEFGAETDSKDAISLPVKLGVSLLKDADGVIDLEVPVEGDIRDPEFKLGKVLWGAFSNIFKKAITAPFKFLGKLVGAGAADDLGSVQFAAGQTELTADEQKKVRKLSQALSVRPALRLEIVGRFDPATDAEQLRSSQFEKALADLIARKGLEQRTQSKVAEEPEILRSSRETGDKDDETFWDRTKNVLTLKPLIKASKTEKPSVPDETDVTVITPEPAKPPRSSSSTNPFPCCQRSPRQPKWRRSSPPRKPSMKPLSRNSPMSVRKPSEHFSRPRRASMKAVYKLPQS